MEAKDVLVIVLREMTAYGYGWRNDWSDFDGRHLRNQLNDLEEWATFALIAPGQTDYNKGSEFYESRR